MRIAPEQLPAQLARGLARAWLVSGDEPLRVEECVAQLRAAARAGGFSERMAHVVESGFDWDALAMSSQSMSLFGERRIIELRVPTGRPSEKGAKLIEQMAEAGHDDTLLVVITGKLDKAASSSAWVSAIESAGTHVAVRPLDAAQLPAWLRARLQVAGLAPEAGVVEFMAHHLEGNLLACAQEVEKLALRIGQGAVTLADVEETLADDARFDVFQLVDTALRGEAAACARMLASLRAEGVEPILVLWAAGREIRSLAPMAQAIAQGRPESSVTGAVWANRKAAVGAALRRHKPRQWQALLARAARLDRVIKGRATGDAWLETEQLLLALAGVRPLPLAAS